MYVFIYSEISINRSIVLQKKKMDSPSQTTTTSTSTSILWDMALGANKVVGVVVMMVCAYKWSTYLATLHENHFWFSNIKVIMNIPINTCGIVIFIHHATGSRT